MVFYAAFNSISEIVKELIIWKNQQTIMYDEKRLFRRGLNDII